MIGGTPGYWQPLAPVSDEASPSSEGPRMCFSGGQAWVVWDEFDGSTYGIAYAVGEYSNWTRGWVMSGYDNGSPDIAPMPDGGLYCVWADGRATPTQIWGSTYTAGEGGLAQPGALSQSTMELSPNPANGGQVTLQYALPRAEPFEVTVLDVSGRAVRTRQVSANSRTGALSIDLGGLNAGVYMVRITGSDLTLSRKLVVQR